MDIKECYRVLELEVGASREAVEAAYCRLLERWHPDRIKPAGDPEGIRQAKLVLERVNEAYLTLGKVAPPASAKPAAAAPPADLPPPGRPTSPPPPQKPISNRAPEPAPATVAPREAEPPPPTTPPKDAWSPLDPLLQKFPPGSPARRFGPIGLAVVAVLILVLAVGTCSSKPSRKGAADPKKTGRLVIKSNRPDTTAEATRIADQDSPATDTFRASGAEPAVAGLPPGRYTLTVHSAGWPDIKQDFSVAAGGAAEVAIRFKSGSLRLDSDPTGATVRWGENELGKTPLTIPALPVGEVPLTLVVPTWPAYTYKATVAEGVETAVTARVPHGRLVVESFPAGASVQLETRLVGTTPLTLPSVPAGVIKVTLRADDFVPVAYNVTIVDNGEAKLNPTLASSIPVLEPGALLSAVWIPETADRGISEGFAQTINFRSRNGIVKNLDRKKLWESWLGKRFRFTGTIKAYDKDSGRIEFVDANNETAKYRVIAQLTPETRANKEAVAPLVKGATFALFGQLDAVEEPKWPAKQISIEFINAIPQPKP
jgi:hypothetical protein